jgi:hypothetical protein
MTITSEKISNSLRSLEKKLFKNNKLHKNKEKIQMEEFDLDVEMKKNFGFDIKAYQGNVQTNRVNRTNLFKKKKSKELNNENSKIQKNSEVNKKKEKIKVNRSSLFFNKFIKKRNKLTSKKRSKGPIVEFSTNKKLIKASTMFNSNIKLGNQNSNQLNEVPDFYKLNKMISKNSQNLMDLNEKNYKRKFEKYRKEKILNRKLPQRSKQKNTKRKIKTMFNYTKHIKQKKCFGDINDENIINLQSRADILYGYEKEMIKDLNGHKSDNEEERLRNTIKESNQVIGNPTEANKDLFANMKNLSETESYSKLGPRFSSFKIEDNQQNIKSQEIDQSNPIINDQNVFYENKENQEKKSKNLMKDLLKNEEEKEDDDVYEICSNDWENNVFGKHTPTKDFLQTEVMPDINS